MSGDKTRTTTPGYGRTVDMWSLGVILYILLCGYPPFYHESRPVLFQLIKKGKYHFHSPEWDEISNEAKDLISKLLVVNPQDRFSAGEVLCHKWLRTHENKLLNHDLTESLAKLQMYQTDSLAKRRWKSVGAKVKSVVRIKKISETSKRTSSTTSGTSDGSSNSTSSPCLMSDN